MSRAYTPLNVISGEVLNVEYRIEQSEQAMGRKYVFTLDQKRDRVRVSVLRNDGTEVKAEFHLRKMAIFIETWMVGEYFKVPIAPAARAVVSEVS